jgi:WD40 repeat protein
MQRRSRTLLLCGLALLLVAGAGSAVAFRWMRSRASPPAREASAEAEFAGRAPDVLLPDPYPVTAAAFSPDSQTLATCTNRNEVKLWDVDRRQVRTTLTAPVGGISALAFAPDGRWLAAAGDRAELLAWDLSAQPPGVVVLQARRGGLPVMATALAYAPHGHALAVATDGSTAMGGSVEEVALWDVVARKRLWTGLGQRGVIRRLAFAPDETLLASGSDGGEIRLWEVATGKLHQSADIDRGERQPPYSVRGLAFSPDGKMLALGVGWGEGLGNVAFWDLASGVWRNRLDPGGERHRALLNCLAFSPGGRVLATGGDINTPRGATVGRIRLWDVESGRSLVVLRCRPHVNQLLFSPNGRFLAAAGAGGTLRDMGELPLWNVDRLVGPRTQPAR